METNDKLTEINTTLDESSSPYYTDMYNAGETKEQLQVGFEVAKPKEASGTIDTSDSTLTKLDNVYTLSVPNPDGKIFSIGINGLEKTFKIGFFGNTALAYSTLETQLQDWLGYDYQVAYVSGTDYTISRTDGTAITKTSPNLCRTITLTNFDAISVIDVIVDGVTVQLAGVTHSGNAGTAITYLKSQLSSTIYYMNDNGNILEIARKDGAIPVITKTQYNKYTYALGYYYGDTPNSGQYLDYTDATIDGITNRYDTYVDARAFRGNWIVRKLSSYTESYNITNTTQTTTTIQYGVDFYSYNSLSDNTNARNRILKTVVKDSACTATRARLYQSSIGYLATVNFVGDVATFNYELTNEVSYQIFLDNNGSSYTYTSSTSATTDRLNLFTVGNGTRYNISQINIGFNGFDLSSYTYSTSISDTFNTYSYLNLNKSDYSTISISSNNHYTNPSSFPDDTLYTSIATTNHLADITTGTLTEITITSTLSGYGIFIPVGFDPKKIQMTATSSGGRSDNGVWTADGQSCTSKYGTTTEFVANKIFKTDASNYGNIITTRRGGFTITWTVNTSNKLDYICT